MDWSRRGRTFPPWLTLQRSFFHAVRRQIRRRGLAGGGPGKSRGQSGAPAVSPVERRKRAAPGLYPVCGYRGEGGQSGGIRRRPSGVHPEPPDGIPGSPGGRAYPGRSFRPHCLPGLLLRQRGQLHFPSGTDPADGNDDGAAEPGFHLRGLPSGGPFRIQ